MTRKIFVVEDHPVMREGYASLIEREADLIHCGEAATGQEALDRIPDADADLVLVDISIPEIDGLELIKRLNTSHPDLPLLVISAHDEILYAERALRAGAKGYVMKHRATTTIIQAIRSVLAGKLYLSPEVQERFTQRYLNVESAEASSPLDQLSDRELEVFQHMGRGLATREIAEAMFVSPKTVETYRSNIKNKLGVSSSAELVRRAVLWVESTT